MISLHLFYETVMMVNKGLKTEDKPEQKYFCYYEK